jgi:hypothetical protein
MQIQAPTTPGEIREAARMSRPRYFWLRFLISNWYATALCLVSVGVSISSLIQHENPKTGPAATLFGVGAIFLVLSWYRWDLKLTKSAELASARSGALSLDDDGVRTTLATGASTFLPWSSYSKWIEGELVFVLTGRDAATIIPLDNSNREAIRGLLMSKIS